jgi:hypothetical protein
MLSSSKSQSSMYSELEPSFMISAATLCKIPGLGESRVILERVVHLHRKTGNITRWNA